MVEQVGDLKKRHPEIVDPILDAIEGVSMSAIHHLNNPKELGRYMDMNHALLDALGVGHPQLSKLVLASRAAGAFGAKITGAGGGGCMVHSLRKTPENTGSRCNRGMRGPGDHYGY